MNPTLQETESPLSFDQFGSPRCYWDPGCTPGPIPPMPLVVVKLAFPGGGAVTASFDRAMPRVLVHSNQEIVEERYRALYTMSAHLWSERRSDGLIVCELLIGNGLCNPAIPGSWRGGVRGNSLAIMCDGWSVYEPIGFGGPDWYMPARGWIYRRFVLYQGSNPDRASELYHLIHLNLEDGHPCLGVLGLKWPRLFGAGRYERMWDAPSQGPFTYDRTSGQPGQGSGYRIVPIGGWEGTEQAARDYMRDLPRTLAGCPLALSDTTGAIPFPEAWPSPSIYFLTRGKQLDAHEVGNYGPFSEEFWPVRDQPRREANPGPSAGRDLAVSWEPEDDAHLCRPLHELEACWTLARSWAARHVIATIAMDVCYSWALKGRLGQYDWSLQKAMQEATAKPHNGGQRYLRQMGWAMNAVALALTYDDPTTTRRAYFRRWGQAMLKYLHQCELPSGFAHVGYPTSSFNGGEPWNQLGVPQSEGVQIQFQIPIFAHCAEMLARALGQSWRESNVRTLTQTCGRSMLRPDHAPHDYITLAINGTPVQKVTTGYGSSYVGHAVHEWHHAALVQDWQTMREIGSHVDTNAERRNQLIADINTHKSDACWNALAAVVIP